MPGHGESPLLSGGCCRRPCQEGSALQHKPLSIRKGISDTKFVRKAASDATISSLGCVWESEDASSRTPTLEMIQAALHRPSTMIASVEDIAGTPRWSAAGGLAICVWGPSKGALHHVDSPVPPHFSFGSGAGRRVAVVIRGRCLRCWHVGVWVPPRPPMPKVEGDGGPVGGGWRRRHGGTNRGDGRWPWQHAPPRAALFRLLRIQGRYRGPKSRGRAQCRTGMAPSSAMVMGRRGRPVVVAAMAWGAMARSLRSHGRPRRPHRCIPWAAPPSWRRQERFR